MGGGGSCGGWGEDVQAVGAAGVAVEDGEGWVLRCRVGVVGVDEAWVRSWVVRLGRTGVGAQRSVLL